MIRAGGYQNPNLFNLDHRFPYSYDIDYMAFDVPIGRLHEVAGNFVHLPSPKTTGAVLNNLPGYEKSQFDKVGLNLDARTHLPLSRDQGQLTLIVNDPVRIYAMMDMKGLTRAFRRFI